MSDERFRENAIGNGLQENGSSWTHHRLILPMLSRCTFPNVKADQRRVREVLVTILPQSTHTYKFVCW